jgi:hypothetical protein
MTNEVTPYQLTVRDLREQIAEIAENTVVVLALPPGLASDPEFETLSNVELEHSGGATLLVRPSMSKPIANATTIVGSETLAGESAASARVVKAIEHSEPCNRKLRRMAELYLERGTLPRDRRAKILDAVSAVQWKFTVASVHLEDLWRVSENARLSLFDLAKNSVLEHRWDEEEMLDATRHLEAFLFQARAFLDVYMRLCCEVLARRCPPLMSTKEFKNALADALPGAEQRAANMQAFFDDEVFGDQKWGSLLRALRDKIAHRDEIRPSRDGIETTLDVRLDWPTIRRMTYDRLAQDFQNGVFELVRSTSPWLFELGWKSGPYDAAAWDAG